MSKFYINEQNGRNYYAYRCFRNLGLSLEETGENPDDLVKVTPNGDGSYVIDMSNMSTRSRRSNYEVTPLPNHNERSDNNRPYEKFEVGKDAYGLEVTVRNGGGEGSSFGWDNSTEDDVVFSDTLCAVIYNNNIYVASKANMSDYSSYTEKRAASFATKIDSGASIINAFVSFIYYSKDLNMFAFKLSYQRFMETTVQTYMVFTRDLNTIVSSYASSLGYGRFDGNYVHGVYADSNILYGACSNTSSEEYIQYGRQLTLQGNSNYSALAAISFVSNNKVVFAVFAVQINSYTESHSTTTNPGVNGSRKPWTGLPERFVDIEHIVIKYCNNHIFVFTGTNYNTINTCYVSKYDTSTQTLTCVNTFNMHGKSTIDLVSIENESKVLFISRDADSTILDVYDFNTETKLESITLQTSDWSTITDFSQYCIYNYGTDEHVTEYTTGLYNGVRFISPAAYTYQVPNITPTESRINAFIKT